MKIRLVTVVWGREYVDTFLRTGLRTLVADGNCPGLARAHDVIYTIYTSQDTVEQIEAAPLFALLREKINVHLHVFSPEEIDATNYGSHGVFWNRELEVARHESAVLFFIIPDVLYAENALTRWASRFEAGAGAIFTIGPQVALETIVPEIESRFAGNDSVCALSQDDLYDLLFRHFHPLHVAMRHDSDRRPSHPEYDLRLVPRHGFVIREIVSHPFCVYPKLFNSLRHYGPRDHLDRIVIEQCLTLSVEPIIKRVHGFYRPWPLDDARLSNMAVWYNYYAVESCEYESTFTYEICASKDSMWPVERRRAVAGGRFFRSQMISAGRLCQIFADLRQRQSHKAANILALAVYAGRLRRCLSIPEGATILVPSESALEADARVNSLLALGQEKALVDLISDHIIFQKQDALKSGRLRNCIRQNEHGLAPGEGALYTARGLPAENLVGHAVRLQAPFKVGSFTVIMIDRVLWRDAVPPHPVVSEGVSPALQPDVHGQPLAAPVVTASTAEHQESLGVDASTFVVPAWAQSSSLRRAIFYAAHVPLLEPLVAAAFHRKYYPRVMPLIQYENAAVHFARRMPRALLRRLRDVPGLAPIMRRGIYIARRILEEIRRNGVSHLWRLALSRLKRTLGPKASIDTIPKHKIELIDEIRNVRTMEVCANVLEDLQTKMVSDQFKSAPLALLRNLLSEMKLDVKKSDKVERSLIKLTQSDPEWADPWLELGFLREDQGRSEDALLCFSRAMKGKKAGGGSSLDPHPAVMAAVHRGRALAKAGNDEGARQCFEAALSQDPAQRLAAIELANVLRRLGHINEALMFYSDGMYYQETRWSLPVPPRSLETLRLPHLTGRMTAILEPGFSPAIS